MHKNVYLVFILLLCSLVRVLAQPQPADLQMSRQSSPPPSYYAYTTPVDIQFSQSLKRYLKTHDEQAKQELLGAYKKSSLPQSYYGLVLTVYGQHGKLKRFIATEEKNDWPKLLEQIKSEESFWREQFLGVQLDFVVAEPKKINFDALLQNTLKNRFEIGVDGLLVSDGQTKKYFLPGDAFTQSIIGKKQLKGYLKKYLKSKPDTWNYKIFHTKSFITYQDKWVGLFRGIPKLAKPLRDRELREIIDNSLQHVMGHQLQDGRFDYYYDASTNSARNHEHPKRNPDTNPYYNIIRHAAGINMYLTQYEYEPQPVYLQMSKQAIQYMLRQLRVYATDNGRVAGFIFYNKKAKLGASGLAVYVLSRYISISGEREYEGLLKLLTMHLLNSIGVNGEFKYYGIYLYRWIGWEENAQYFNFYYPGEALLGLVTYYKLLANPVERAQLQYKINQAFHFLLRSRPKLYPDQFKSLPSDSWLMMAANAWYPFEPSLQEELAEFVFQQADQMVAHMYTEQNALYPDYVGAFYYKYGDHAYPDAARGEGLMAALELAKSTDEKQKYQRYLHAVEELNWAVMHLYNSPVSSYYAKDKAHTIGGIRFKYTRQWFRIDTIAHVINYYQNYLRLTEEN